MQIVIDIPEGMLDELNTCKFPIQDAYRLCSIIENGKPLQKGHGRLIDADKMTSELLTIDSNYAYLADWTLRVLDTQPIIVEAEEDNRTKNLMNIPEKDLKALSYQRIAEKALGIINNGTQYSNKRYLVVFDGYQGGYGSEFFILGLYFTTVDADEAISRVVEDAHVNRKIFCVIELQEGWTYKTNYSKRDETYKTDKYIGGYTE